jgi:hypothetical protein
MYRRRCAKSAPGAQRPRVCVKEISISRHDVAIEALRACNLLGGWLGKRCGIVIAPSSSDSPNTEATMNDPRSYIDEIRQNLRKLQSQGKVTPTENALFGMIDGLAGLHLVTLERVTRLEQMLSPSPWQGEGRGEGRRGADSSNSAARSQTPPS